MINNLIKAFCLTVVLSFSIFAQNNNNSNNSEEYKKYEFFGGYSNQQVGIGETRPSLNGFEVAAVLNFNRYFGIKADVSGAYKNNRSLYNFLGGVQIKDNASKTRFKPFAHALVGVAHNRNSNECPRGSLCAQVLVPDFTVTDTGFGGAFGGGLDIKISDRIDFRAIQVDYNPIYSNSRVDNNVRFGIGIVFK